MQDVNATNKDPRYPWQAQTVNVVFILLFLGVPIGIALANPGLPKNVANSLILLGFGLVGLAFMDWFHLYLSNTFKSLWRNFLFGITLALGAAIASSLVSEHRLMALLGFHGLPGWSHALEALAPGLLHVYIVGLGIAIIEVLSLPRLLIIRLLTDKPLPGTEDHRIL